MLMTENFSLKHELDVMVAESEAAKSKKAESVDSSLMSISSKTSKYPEVECPHFKNGGKCIHCIKAWKAEQKMKKKQESQV